MSNTLVVSEQFFAWVREMDPGEVGLTKMIDVWEAGFHAGMCHADTLRPQPVHAVDRAKNAVCEHFVPPNYCKHISDVVQ